MRERGKNNVMYFHSVKFAVIFPFEATNQMSAIDRNSNKWLCVEYPCSFGIISTKCSESLRYTRTCIVYILVHMHIGIELKSIRFYFISFRFIYALVGCFWKENNSICADWWACVCVRWCGSRVRPICESKEERKRISMLCATRFYVWIFGLLISHSFA